MPNDPYTDDEYDDTYEEVHGDEPTRDQYVDETTDDTFFPYGAGGAFYPPAWGIWPTRDTVDADYDEREAAEYDADEHGTREGVRGEGSDVRRDASEDDSWWDEGLIGLLLVVGVVLFFFPEPATSAIGIGLIGLGVLAWIIDWLA